MNQTARITHYDFSNLLYSSFYLSGLAASASRFSFQFDVSHRTPELEALSADTEWDHMLLFRAQLPGDEFHFCIDTRDSAFTGKARGNGYDLTLLERVRIYFKVNYNEIAIATDPLLAPHAEKILPVMPFFPVRFRQWPRVTPMDTMGWTPVDTLRRFKHLRGIPDLDEVIGLRDAEEDIDIFFVVNFSGDRRHVSDDEHRYLIMRELQRNRDIRSVVGFVGKGRMPAKFAELRAPRYPLREYLARVARSRVAIYVRGLHDCLSFKFAQLLAMGKPIAGQPIINNKENVTDFDYFDEQFAFESPEDIVTRAAELIGDPEKRSRLARANANTFDSRLTPQAAAADILERIGLPAGE